MALDAVTERLQRIVTALEEANVPYALVGDQAVALWVATKDPALLHGWMLYSAKRAANDLLTESGALT
jgi:hypothetical protein